MHDDDDEDDNDRADALPREWPHVRDSWRLTATELNVLWRVWLGEKHQTIAHWLGQHPADDRRRPAAWGGPGSDRTKHAVDAHWRSIKRKMGQPTHVLVIRAVDDLLADLRQEAAVAEAVQAATEPLQAAIAARDQTIAELRERLKEMEERAAPAPSVPAECQRKPRKRKEMKVQSQKQTPPV